MPFPIFRRSSDACVAGLGSRHSRPQRPRSFWSAPRIATSGPVQRHSGFEWLCKHNRLRPEPIRFVRLDSEHAQSDGKSVIRGLPWLDLARGRDSWCWPKGARPLGTRMGSRWRRWTACLRSKFECSNRRTAYWKWQVPNITFALNYWMFGKIAGIFEVINRITKLDDRMSP